MFKLHLISELQEAFITAKDKRAEPLKTKKPPILMPPATKKVVVQEKKCTGCGTCALNCPSQCISILQNKKYQVVDIHLSSCIYCGACVEVCPAKAITIIPGRELPASSKDHLHHQLMIKLKKCDGCREIIGTCRSILKILREYYAPSGVDIRALPWIQFCPACRRKLQGHDLIKEYTR